MKSPHFFIKALIYTVPFLTIASLHLNAQSLADAKDAIDAEKYQKGKELLKVLTLAQPKNAEVFFFLGKAYLKTTDLDSAKTAFENGLKLNPKFALNYVGIGSLQLNAKDTSAAKASFNQGLALTDKKDARTLREIGKAYLNNSNPDYTQAGNYLQKAKALNEKDAETYLTLGDLYVALERYSEAYSAYRSAYDLDKTLLRAKVALGIINKNAKAFQESIDEFNKVLAINPNYGPAYRELAETYYRWGNAEPKDYDSKVKKALDYYTKYMDRTDRSLDSRLRYADFLILTKNYKLLEQEVQEMVKIGQANIRVYRYLGYSAYENGNFASSVEALKTFFAKADPSRILPSDYFYLGKAQVKNAQEVEGFQNIAKAVELDSTNVDFMTETAKAFYVAKKFDQAAIFYGKLVANPKSKTVAYDNFYLGMSHYFDYASKNKENLNPGKDILTKADSAFSYVIRVSPTTPDAYLFRARVKRLADDAENPAGLMVPDYEKYIELIIAKPENLTNERLKPALMEAYNNLAATYSQTDKEKAKLYLDQALALDPTNEYAKSLLESLKTPPAKKKK